MLREDLTAQATLNFTSLNATTSYIVELLEKYGYAPDEGSVPVQPGVSVEDESMIDASLFPPLPAEVKSEKN
jgi:hypothetical protein